MGDEGFSSIGEKALSNLYTRATACIARGIPANNVAELRNVLVAMDALLDPISSGDFDYASEKPLIQKEMDEATALEGKRLAGMGSPKLYSALLKWFKALNRVINSNKLLFPTQFVFQENNEEKWRGEDNGQTSL